MTSLIIHTRVPKGFPELAMRVRRLAWNRYKVIETLNFDCERDLFKLMEGTIVSSRWQWGKGRPYRVLATVLHIPIVESNDDDDLKEDGQPNR